MVVINSYCYLLLCLAEIIYCNKLRENRKPWNYTDCVSKRLSNSFNGTCYHYNYIRGTSLFWDVSIATGCQYCVYKGYKSFGKIMFDYGYPECVKEHTRLTGQLHLKCYNYLKHSYSQVLCCCDVNLCNNLFYVASIPLPPRKRWNPYEDQRFDYQKRLALALIYAVTEYYNPKDEYISRVTDRLHGYNITAKCATNRRVKFNGSCYHLRFWICDDKISDIQVRHNCTFCAYRTYAPNMSWPRGYVFGYPICVFWFNKSQNCLNNVRLWMSGAPQNGVRSGGKFSEENSPKLLRKPHPEQRSRMGWKSKSVVIITISSVKILYTWATRFSKFVPESNLLLICGLLIGFVFNRLKTVFDFERSDIFKIKTNSFFYILLPPIILEASFAIYHATFASNIVGVLLFAFVATLLNFFSIAIGLNILAEFNYMTLHLEDINANTIWIFSALIVAVDPVAVLAIFQEIHVDNNLYYLVFGESLLNDGVSVVLYDVMIEMSEFEVVEIGDILRAIVAFSLVSIGGGVIGCVMSVVTCLLTRFTVKTPIIEPIIVLTFGYLSYLLANAISWSGIISMIVYGVLQAAYGFQNITSKSLILIKRLSKILSSLSESMIFLNLGVTVTSISINFMSSFMMWSVFLCLYSRFTFTLLLSGFINYFRFNIRKIKYNEQFIIAYGGLRGGIAFCLAELVDRRIHANKEIIEESTVCIVIFTIFFMGFTMKPLVKMLNIQIAKPEELCLFVQVAESAVEHLLAGVEEIIGLRGRNAMHEFMANVDELYVRPFLQRDRRGRDEKIMKMFEKMNLTMHMATTAAGTPMSDYYLHKLKPHMRNFTGNSRADFCLPKGMSHMTEDMEMSHVSRFKVRKEDYSDELSFLPVDKSLAEPVTFAHRMTAMFYRKRRSLALSRAKSVGQRLQSKFSSESDADIISRKLSKKDSKHVNYL